MTDNEKTNKSTKHETQSNEKQVLNNDEDENLVIYGYKIDLLKTIITHSLYFLSIGLIRLIFHWYPRWRLCATHSKCNLKIAEKVLVVDTYQNKYKSYFVEEIKNVSAHRLFENRETKLTVYLDDGTMKELPELRMIHCKKLCYIWDEGTERFSRLTGLDKGKKCSEYHHFQGYPEDEQALRQIAYGKNEIEIRVNTILSLLVLEALTPFYIFQVFSLIVWFAEEYYYYTIAIVVMSTFGISTSIIQTRRNQKSLKDSVHSADMVTVWRGGHERNFQQTSSHNLVPGDVIVIPRNDSIMQCDAVLLNGNCIVNESMLTGESVPITKTPIPKLNVPYNVKEDSFHTLFCGTKIIQTRCGGNEPILAVVLRTGYLTTKGELVRSILYPPPSDFKFDQDSYKFIGILSVIAILGCVYTIVSKSTRDIGFTEVILKALDLITIVVPPALPAAMTVGKLYALNRLKKQDIFCINSRVINVSGSVDCVCFDKTGTLTEDGLDMWGVVPVVNNKLDEPLKEITSLPMGSLLSVMATCHSIAVIDGELLGDPLDIKVFEFTRWTLEESTHGKDQEEASNPSGDPVSAFRKVALVSSDHYHEYEILRQYQFSSTLQRMSVIAKSNTSNALKVFCKGSPEMVISLSKRESIPSNIQSRIKEFTEKGYRVIAAGVKTLEDYDIADVPKLERSEAETGLQFLGLIILENRIKSATPDVIKMLRGAEIKVVMITGDNIETALSVAKECGIVEKGEIVVDVRVNSEHQEKPTLMFSVADSSKALAIEEYFRRKHSFVDVSSIESGLSKFEYSYAMTGTTWSLLREHFPDQIPELVTRGIVFARMSGHQKQQLVQELQNLGYYVAMCGDGANDCGALKAAHVGISLSEEESSIASPFTSKNPDISCVPKVIREGRAALTTSIGVFKFMICYSLIQFTSAIILYGIDSNLTSVQFLFIDICLTLQFMSFFGKTEAYPGGLDRSRPLKSLLCVTSIVSILFQMLLMICFQIAAYKLVQTYRWYKPFVYDPEIGSYSCYENYAVFAISLFQYISISVSFSKGKPFRKAIYTNLLLMASLLVMTVICIYIVTVPAKWIVTCFELEMPPHFDLGCTIVGLAVVQFACSLLAEDIIVNYFLDKKLVPKFKILLKTRKNYLGDGRNFKLHTKDDLAHDSAFVSNEIEKRSDSKQGKGFVNPAFQVDYNETCDSQTTKL